MTSVLVTGMAVVDFLFEVDAMPDRAEKYVATNAQIVGGGGAANAACAIARLGGNAMLAARVGDDMIGNLIIEDLKTYAVDCSLIHVNEGGRSSYSSVLLDANGERQIVNYRGAGLSDEVSLIECSNPAAVLADTRWLAGAMASMCLAREKNIPGVLDAEPPIDSDLLHAASHIAFSKQGLESLSGGLSGQQHIEQALRDVQKEYAGWVAMTDGANGVYSLTEDRFLHQPATRIDVVDTLGAGDVWHGAFAWSLGCGNDEKTAVRFASAAATLKCANSGGGRASPLLKDVERFMQDTNV